MNVVVLPDRAKLGPNTIRRRPRIQEFLSDTAINRKNPETFQDFGKPIKGHFLKGSQRLQDASTDNFVASPNLGILGTAGGGRRRRGRDLR